MINNRQAGRRRGRGGGNNGGMGGGQRGGGQQGNGSRIDNRSRGNATQLYEKYKNMAADAQRAGDRVNTEYYLQFADHYFRVLSEQRGRFEDQQQQRRPRDEFGSGEFGSEESEFGANDYGDEGEPVRGVGQVGEQGGEQNGAPRFDDRQRDDRQQDGRGRDERPRDDRYRDDRPRGDREAGGRERNGERQSRGEWQDRPRERRPDPAPVEIAGQRRAEPLAAGESLEHRAEEVLEADRPLEAPARRRGRPRREEQGAREEQPGRDEQPADVPSVFEADRLPPSLSASVTVAANDEAPAKPRRRRARPVEETPNAAE